MMSWSDIPGMVELDLLREGLVEKTKSSVLESLVVQSWTWLKNAEEVTSIRVCCSALSDPLGLTVWLSQLMSGQLKLPASRMCG